MTRTRWIVSAFIVWHLTSITIASLPTAPWVARVGSPTLFPALTRTADQVAGGVTPVVAAVRRAATWVVGKPVGWYIDLTGLGQYWAMFSNPPQYDRYWRVRYYITGPNERTWMATELIGPSHREDRIRLLQSYRDSYRDKAFEIAFDGFVKRRKPGVVGPGTLTEELPDDLAPIARFFARRFAATLPEGERIIRTEVWVGTVGNKPIGEPVNASVAVERRAVSARLHRGPDRRAPHRPALPAVSRRRGGRRHPLADGVLRGIVTDAERAGRWLGRPGCSGGSAIGSLTYRLTRCLAAHGLRRHGPARSGRADSD